MKIERTIVCLLLFSIIFLSGCSLGKKYTLQSSSKTKDQDKTIVTPEKTEVQRTLEAEWQEIINSEKFLQCYQSKKDFDQKKNEILPKYKEVLNKEIESKKLTTGDEYIKYIYSFFGARGEDYRIFEETANLKKPRDKEQIKDMKSLLEYIYCPNVNKIPVVYPLTPEGCVELLSTWMAPFDPMEVPEPSSYQVPEEYTLALQKYKEGKKTEGEYTRKCCYQGNIGSSCRSINQWLYQQKTPTLIVTPGEEMKSIRKAVDEFLRNHP